MSDVLRAVEQIDKSIKRLREKSFDLPEISGLLMAREICQEIRLGKDGESKHSIELETVVSRGVYHHQDPRTGHLTGGEYIIPGLEIHWEDSREGGDSDGVTLDDVMIACLDRLRLRQYFKSQRSRNNALAVTHLEDALLRLGAKIPEMKRDDIYVKDEKDISEENK